MSFVFCTFVLTPMIGLTHVRNEVFEEGEQPTIPCNIDFKISHSEFPPSFSISPCLHIINRLLSSFVGRLLVCKGIETETGHKFSGVERSLDKMRFF